MQKLHCRFVMDVCMSSGLMLSKLFFLRMFCEPTSYFSMLGVKWYELLAKLWLTVTFYATSDQISTTSQNDHIKVLSPSGFGATRWDKLFQTWIVSQVCNAQWIVYRVLHNTGLNDRWGISAETYIVVSFVSSLRLDTCLMSRRGSTLDATMIH